MLRRLAQSVTVLGLAVSLSAAPPAAADAADQPRRAVRTTMTMQPTEPDGFDVIVKGRVRSADDRCVARRRVSLSSINSVTGGVTQLGAERATRTGRYLFRVSALITTDTTFVAAVDRFRARGKRPVTCSAASASNR